VENFDWSWILAALSIAGTVFNVKKSVICFYLWAIGEIFWTIFDIRNGAYGRAFLDVVHFGFAIWGIFEWSEKNEQIKLK
jgi:nicotinamide riboside transporter PnuC